MRLRVLYGNGAPDWNLDGKPSEFNELKPHGSPFSLGFP
jgi:hypothetical protein